MAILPEQHKMAQITHVGEMEVIKSGRAVDFANGTTVSAPQFFGSPASEASRSV